MIQDIIKEMEIVEKLNISGEEKKTVVLNKFKKDMGKYYTYNSYLISTTIDFIANMTKTKFNTTINN
jgi:hypothetical protein